LAFVLPFRGDLGFDELTLRSDDDVEIGVLASRMQRNRTMVFYKTTATTLKVIRSLSREH
jgi:hypothetical protein